MVIVSGMANSYSHHKMFSVPLQWVQLKRLRTVLVLIFAMLVGVSSCENSVYPDVPCNCDFLNAEPDWFGEKIPRSADLDPKTSILGTWLSYQDGNSPTYIIQNLKTGDRSEVNIEPALKPDESLYFLSLSAWCPYDDNVALVTAEVRYVNPQGIEKTGRQLFTYNVITQKSERITPTQFGNVQFLVEISRVLTPLRFTKKI